jgi:hypothetical protein
MGDRRTRFSLIYFVIVIAFVIGLNYMLGQASTSQISYSELKQRITAGQVANVVAGPDRIRAEPTDSMKAAGAPDVWTTTMPAHGDDELIPLLDEHVPS